MMTYQIQHISDAEKNLNFVELYTDFSSAKIVLNQGASLQELTINTIPVIKELGTISYDKSFASSILFPFANRIKDGKYIFNAVAYQTEINQTKEFNALHGFVHDKEFKIVKKYAKTNEASVVLEYNETEFTKGFPFTYKIQLQYLLTKNALEVKVKVENTSKSEFPFTLGWHPYFYSEDLDNSFLKFDSSKQLVFDTRMIPKGSTVVRNSKHFELKNKKLDDCFYLDSTLIEFVTPKYKMELSSSENEHFLQVYTPPKKNTIAIEPTTGTSNSFNTKIGLKTLLPKEKYQISWKLIVTNRP
jgi:aldose 1-epimerase